MPDGPVRSGGRAQATRRGTPPVDDFSGHGRSPGSRVAAIVMPSQGQSPSGVSDNRSPLTVAGAAPAWPRFDEKLGAPDSLLALHFHKM